MGNFKIPKQTDRMLIVALTAIRDGLSQLRPLQIQVTLFEPAGEIINLTDQVPENTESIKYVLSEESEVMPSLLLKDPNAGNVFVLTINRTSSEITDMVTVIGDHGWVNGLPKDKKGQIVVKLNSLARKHLRAIDTQAHLLGGPDSEWNRFKDLQVATLNSLQKATETLLIESTKKSLEAEHSAKEKFDRLENDLRKNYDISEQKLNLKHSAQMGELLTRESALKKLEESFNTKEARYVARKEQENQINQIKGWLEEWSLTKGTRSKRWAVTAIYIVGIVFTGYLTILYSGQNIDLLKGKDFSQVQWWQWMLLSLKSIFPLVVCTTLIVYYIRWSVAWARQHSEEEFRNRARMLDVGRTAWLLEAVRDAQDNQKELPPELLKELSRNLFTYAKSQ